MPGHTSKKKSKLKRFASGFSSGMESARSSDPVRSGVRSLVEGLGSRSRRSRKLRETAAGMSGVRGRKK